MRNSVNKAINRLLIAYQGEEKEAVEKFSVGTFVGNKDTLTLMIGRNAYAIR